MQKYINWCQIGTLQQHMQTRNYEYTARQHYRDYYNLFTQNKYISKHMVIEAKMAARAKLNLKHMAARIKLYITLCDRLKCAKKSNNTHIWVAEHDLLFPALISGTTRHLTREYAKYNKIYQPGINQIIDINITNGIKLMPKFIRRLDINSLSLSGSNIKKFPNSLRARNLYICDHHAPVVLPKLLCAQQRNHIKIMRSEITHLGKYNAKCIELSYINNEINIRISDYTETIFIKKVAKINWLTNLNNKSVKIVYLQPRISSSIRSIRKLKLKLSK